MANKSLDSDPKTQGGSAHTLFFQRNKMTELERLQNKLHKIKIWIDAYPLDVFPEPDFKKAAQVLKQNGITLDSISASNMRHVLNGIKDILEK